MRILHVLDHSLPLQSGYSFRTLSILREQRALGWETLHVTTPRHTASGPPVETIEGLRFHRTSAPAGPAGRLPIAREIMEIRATAATIEEVCRNWRPDILHAHSPVLDVLPALSVGRRLGIPVVYEVRAFWEDAAVSEGGCAEGGLRYRLSRWLETRALKQAQAITTICEGLRTDMIARGLPAGKITVVPNAVDSAVFKPQAGKDPELVQRHGLGSDIVCGFIGSFYRYEGLDLLLYAMVEVLRRQPNFRLLLVGGGSERERLQALAATLGLGDRVIFTGRVPHAKVDGYYSVIDMLVYPRLPLRLTELVTPLKPLESLAMGKIVVASAVGGHRQLLTGDSTAFLFRPGDVTSLAEAIMRAAASRDQWSQLSERARLHVERNCAWSRTVARYEPIYRSLMDAVPASV